MQTIIIITLVILLALAVIGLLRSRSVEQDLEIERILTMRQAEVIQELMEKVEKCECDTVMLNRK